jgi:glutamyl-Q tRNA(Asp) synthetase
MSSNYTDAGATPAFSFVGHGPVGRFAPSPTGKLHAGSLLAAVGSYLDARTTGARWLLRIEDLDTPRVVPGCADEMLRTLEAYGFEWDGEVVYQSARRDAYRAALATLSAAGRTFRCSCSRKVLAGDGDDQVQGYPGTCRDGPTGPGPTAMRFRVSDRQVRFDDLFLGSQALDTRLLGDFVVERRDGIATYQLAVVVDDAWQGVTRVVRGADLLTSTPWQIELQAALGLPRPSYGHLPVLTEPDGRKLSKSHRAIPIPGGPGPAMGADRSDQTAAPTVADRSDLTAVPTVAGRSDLIAVSRALTSTLTHLYQSPPPELAQASTKDVWKWAVAHWSPQALAGRTRVELSATSDK